MADQTPAASVRREWSHLHCQQEQLCLRPHRQGPTSSPEKSSGLAEDETCQWICRSAPRPRPAAAAGGCATSACSPAASVPRLAVSLRLRPATVWKASSESPLPGAKAAAGTRVAAALLPPAAAELAAGGRGWCPAWAALLPVGVWTCALADSALRLVHWRSTCRRSRMAINHGLKMVTGPFDCKRPVPGCADFTATTAGTFGTPVLIVKQLQGQKTYSPSRGFMVPAGSRNLLSAITVGTSSAVRGGGVAGLLASSPDNKLQPLRRQTRLYPP